ncbi:hypothetical protein BD626DRAFT_629301 [Schizophyllum amplum]|uniref:F-box domain-containing protein n=1 Tax=Schizophyllum amplum TaxID=97359 RepID=A0A550CHS5_9AGAR|nr:hypothetical protein BD626DRAFT_629301 [Auriculariopsis ampla]
MASTNCLFIPELFDIVCAHSDPRDLCRMARTCRAWQSIALDSIWNTLSSMNPILGLLPRDAWTTETKMIGWGLEVEVLIFTRPLTAADWERPLAYTSRVRSLTADVGTRSIAASQTNIVDILSTCPVPLFPHLRTLSLRVSSSAPLLKFFDSLVGHTDTLDSLALWLDQACASQQVPLVPLNDGLHSRCPNLFKFALYAPWLTASRDILAGWKHLRVLRAPRLSREALRHVATLARLEQLVLTDSRAQEFDAGETLPFPALARLEMRLDQLDGATAFLSSLDSEQPLRSVKLHYTAKAPTLLVETFMRALTEQCDQLDELLINGVRATLDGSAEEWNIPKGQSRSTATA